MARRGEAGSADEQGPGESPTRDDVPPGVRAQLLSTEHWSLLATRSLTWNETFSRAGWYLTVVSAAMVALALVADSTDFGTGFRLAAFTTLVLLVIIGLATVVRMVQLDRVDVGLVAGMNRLRRGYLDIAPDLEPYLVTGHDEDLAAIMQSYGAQRTRIPAVQYLSSIALLISTIVAVLVAALAGLIADTAGTGPLGAALTGITAGIATLAGIVLLVVRHVRRSWSDRSKDTA